MKYFLYIDLFRFNIGIKNRKYYVQFSLGILYILLDSRVRYLI